MRCSYIHFDFILILLSRKLFTTIPNKFTFTYFLNEMQLTITNKTTGKNIFDDNDKTLFPYKM